MLIKLSKENLFFKDAHKNVFLYNSWISGETDYQIIIHKVTTEHELNT